MTAVFQRDKGRLVWRSHGQTVVLEACGRDGVRVRATCNAALAELPGALVRRPPPRPRIEIGEHEATLVNGRLKVTMDDTPGRLRFLRADTGAVLLEETYAHPTSPTLSYRPRIFTHVGGDLYRIEARFEAYDGERLFGLGQHRHGRLDLKGTVTELIQRNGEVTIPFLVSSRGYGFLWNNPAIGHVELAANRTRWVVEQSRQIDYVVSAGDGFGDLLARYADLTGHAPMLPEWAAGFWQCKLRYLTQKELLGVAREYHRRRLPLSVIVVDFFHWTRQGEWRWDERRWPDPAAMVRELAAMGVRLMVSIWPSVNPKCDGFEEMRRRGLLIGTHRGANLLMPFIDTRDEGTVNICYYDATHPEARAMLWEKVKASYYDNGVKVFWLDACEPEIEPLQFENLRLHAGEAMEVACAYPFFHQQAFHDGLRAAGETEIVTLCRSAWAGSQRLAAAVWSGDVPSTWEMFRIQICAGLNMMMSGIPWWTTDIGGFYGADGRDPKFHELLVRWFQYGAFCPLFRLHGVRDPQIEGEVSGGPNEVWSFGEPVYRILREYLLLRERLRPYIMKQMARAARAGTPPMRPLFFDFAGDVAAYDVRDAFLFGPDLLVAPVVEPGARARRVYLPQGAAWTDAWDGEAYDGGQWIEAEAPLDRLPLFLRDRARLPIRGNGA